MPTFDDENIKLIDTDGNEFESLMAKGGKVPDPRKDIWLDNGMVMPLGRLGDRADFEGGAWGSGGGEKEVGGWRMRYNEFVVYREDQSKIRYIVDVKS